MFRSSFYSLQSSIKPNYAIFLSVNYPFDGSTSYNVKPMMCKSLTCAVYGVDCLRLELMDTILRRKEKLFLSSFESFIKFLGVKIGLKKVSDLYPRGYSKSDLHPRRSSKIANSLTHEGEQNDVLPSPTSVSSSSFHSEHTIHFVHSYKNIILVNFFLSLPSLKTSKHNNFKLSANDKRKRVSLCEVAQHIVLLFEETLVSFRGLLRGYKFDLKDPRSAQTSIAHNSMNGLVARSSDWNLRIAHNAVKKYLLLKVGIFKSMHLLRKNKFSILTRVSRNITLLDTPTGGYPPPSKLGFVSTLIFYSHFFSTGGRF